MRRKLMTLLASLIGAISLCDAQTDTLGISDAYTTHLVFSSDITYADLSNPSYVAAKIIEQNRNLLALKARSPFPDSTSVSALESNGRIHTFIVVYDQSPERLVIDMREGDVISGSVSLGGRTDAPQISEIAACRQNLHHIGARKYRITVMCEEIISYSDVTYVVLSLKNKSSVSYSITDATFVIESKKKGKRSVAFEKNLSPKNRHGSLSAAPGEKARIAYSFDKMTLAEGQVLKVYLYEDGGQRNLEMTIGEKDINRAGCIK